MVAPPALSAVLLLVAQLDGCTLMCLGTATVGVWAFKLHVAAMVWPTISDVEVG
jgi:hypothetical protein